MTVKRLDHISIVIEDLESAIAFFTELGLQKEGVGSVEGEWVDRINGMDGIRADIVLMSTPDGYGKLELTKFHTPTLINLEPAVAPPNTLGLRSVMFTVEHLDNVVAHMQKHGGELVGEIVQYKDVYRLCYMRGPGNIIVSLAEELFT